MRALIRISGRVGLVLALVLAAGVASVVVTGGAPSEVRATTILGSGGEYHPITPARVLDTRGATRINDVDRPGAKAVTRGSGSRFDVTVLGQGGLPPVSDAGDVYAVAATVTVVNPTVPGYLRAWGTGATEGTSSTVNFRAGQTVPNMTLLVPGADGKVSIRMATGGPTDGVAQVLIDVVGWFSTTRYDTAGSRLIPLNNPTRLYDTREAPRRAPIGAGQSVALQIRGRAGVPDSNNVNGVLVNLTGVNNTPSSTNTFVSALPTRPSGMPTTSNINLSPGQVKANLAIVPVGSDGRIHLYNANGAAHVVVDVVGFLQPRDPNTRVGRVIPLASPFRVFDTRDSRFPGGQLGPGEGEDWSFGEFANDVRFRRADGSFQSVGKQSGVLGNLTATGLTRPSGWFTPVTTFLTAYPTPQDRASGPPPGVSNLNLVEGASVPNMALLRYGGPTPSVCGQATAAQLAQSVCQVRFYNYNGNVHYLFDATAVVLAD